MKVHFDRESHLKAKQKDDETRKYSSESDQYYDDQSSNSTSSDSDSMVGHEVPQLNKDKNFTTSSKNQSFKKKFKNVDRATCWLNACLQFLLAGIDHSSYPP